MVEKMVHPGASQDMTPDGASVGSEPSALSEESEEVRHAVRMLEVDLKHGWISNANSAANVAVLLEAFRRTATENASLRKALELQ